MGETITNKLLFRDSYRHLETQLSYYFDIFTVKYSKTTTFPGILDSRQPQLDSLWFVLSMFSYYCGYYWVISPVYTNIASLISSIYQYPITFKIVSFSYMELPAPSREIRGKSAEFDGRRINTVQPLHQGEKVLQFLHFCNFWTDKTGKARHS